MPPRPQLYVKVGNTFREIHEVPGAPPQHAPVAPVVRPASPQMDPQRLPQNVLAELASGQFVTVPAWYTISLVLGGAAGDSQGGAVSLRPERFFLYRVTLATNGDCYPFVAPSSSLGGYSNQLRSVEVVWGDEFTKFFGEQPCMAASLFGDAAGFLDLVQPILFQGRQTLNAKLNRFHWPSDQAADDTRWDLSFQGLGILPTGHEASGGM